MANPYDFPEAEFWARADRRGEKHPRARLTESQVREIRADARILREIAKDHGVSIQQIHRIQHGASWSEASQKPSIVNTNFK